MACLSVELICARLFVPEKRRQLISTIRVRNSYQINVGEYLVLQLGRHSVLNCMFITPLVDMVSHHGFLTLTTAGDNHDSRDVFISCLYIRLNTVYLDDP
jgi:hypothetical protein